MIAELTAAYANTSGSSSPPSGSQSQRRSTSCSSSLHMPSLMFLLWQPQKLVSQPPLFLPLYNNPCPSKLSLQSYALPAGGALFLALSVLGCLYWGGDSQTGWILPDALECGQAARSHGFTQQLVLPGCTLKAGTGVELLLPTLQRRVLACTENSALLSTWHCCWNDSCTIVWESIIKKCCGWSFLFNLQ